MDAQNINQDELFAENESWLNHLRPSSPYRIELKPSQHTKTSAIIFIRCFSKLNHNYCRLLSKSKKRPNDSASKRKHSSSSFRNYIPKSLQLPQQTQLLPQQAPAAKQTQPQAPQFQQQPGFIYAHHAGCTPLPNKLKKLHPPLMTA